MIYAITSKKGGCGRTTVALLTSILTALKVNGSTILVDLGYGNDIYSLLKSNKPNASIDNLISAIGLDESFVNFDENLVDVNGMFFLPGTQVNQSRYLEKRYTSVKDLLELLQVKFNSVIIDVDYSLYEDLVDLGLSITPIHVLDQNILNIQKYQEDIKLGLFNGFYVLNKYNKNVFPDYSYFDRNFKQGSLVVLDEDETLISTINRKNIDLKTVKSSSCYEGLNHIAEIIANDVTVTNSSYVSKSSSMRKGLFTMLFNNLFGVNTQKKKKAVSTSKKTRSGNKSNNGKKKGKKGNSTKAVAKEVAVGGEDYE